MKTQLVTLLALTVLGGTAFADTSDDKAKHSYDRDSMYESAPTGVDSEATSTATSMPAGDSAMNMPAKSDSEIQAMARRSLQSDTSLSSEARNVNIRVQNGRATLQGQAASPEEKESIRQKVMAVEGINSVNNKVLIKE
ncbi:hypothetical protein AZI87_04580 [Bdellovibrio bacteriovorus]|uniref:BON domain-containing protein n=1 Tax=Bdellovibrio bacteriovorus TaxID=959 RepID=A0A161PE08_BDEBC|nr:BON domain-containing protein [Bdellovibrio bacteriovorus]KYG68524.1 hypothetical protein AZI87_04580 [Bdellovibrio bacteriovorus]